MEKIVFESVVGSHIWGMNTPDSDIDLFRIYQMPTRNILLGQRIDSKPMKTSTEEDIQTHEIGVVYQQILQSNINFVIGLASPLVNTPLMDSHIGKFVDIALACVDRNIYHSVKGMAVGNYKKYIEKNGDKLPEEKYNKILRIVQFGIDFLETGDFNFNKFTGGNRAVYETMMKELNNAYENSAGRVTMSLFHKRFADALIDIRMSDLRNLY